VSLLTVTLNACVDKTYTVPGFALDRVHRPAETLITAGGKGINVSRVYHLLGAETTATGFLGGANGEWLRRAILGEGTAPEFVFVSEESRVCIAIMDPVGGTQTELNENGPQIVSEDVDALFACLRELLPHHRVVVISGSMPPGTPVDVYADIIRLAQGEFDVPVILDSSGEALAQGVEARPWLVKPNIHELAVLGIAQKDVGEAAVALRVQFRVPMALVTDGARGAALATEEGVWKAVPPPITAASAVGSGDSLTAAFVWAIENGYTVSEALRLGVAAGAANATTYGAGQFPRSLVFELAERVVLTSV
jgi:tagatose 6-phosphate kinase